MALQKFKTHGKWILAGEHSVLRGCSALVFPVRSRYLDFRWEESDADLQVQIQSGNNDLQMAFWGVLEKALQQVSIKREQIRGTLFLESNIPVGAGMGASATLCVSLAKWFHSLGYVHEEEQYDFAKSLEDLFHGQSSGVDVAVALHHKPLLFKRPSSMVEFLPVWTPHIYLSYCGKRGVTADCIKKVEKFIEQNPKRGVELDQQMQKAVDLAKDSLIQVGNLDLLKSSIELAAQCFEEWGLLNQDLNSHMKELKNLGAIATKPTGSGDGGFVISLWSQKIETNQFSIPLIEA